MFAWGSPSSRFGNYASGLGNWRNAPLYGVPQAQATDRTAVYAIHTGTCLVGLADGSARGVSASVSQPTWEYAVRADDGQVLGSNW